MNVDANQPQTTNDPSHFVQYNTSCEDSPVIHHVPFPGGVYQGDLDNQTRSGLGLFLWNNGDSYFGYWHSNKMHGKGVFCFNTGIYIEGTFISDFVHGPAAIYYPDQSFIEGVFTKGKLAGRALLYDSIQELWFIQDYKQDNEIVLEGKGKPNYSDYCSTLYEYLPKSLQTPELMNVKLQVMKKQELLQQRGPCLAGFEISSEIRHFGLWDANQIQGLGIRISSKSIESGHYQNHKLHGIGQKIRFGDFLYKGELKDGLFHGQGTLFDWKTKIRSKGTFINGKPLQSCLQTSYTIEDLQTLNTYLEYVNPLDKATTNNLSIKNYTRTFPIAKNETPIPTPEPIVSYTIDQRELSKKAKSKPTTPQKPSTINFDIDLNDFSLDVQDLALTMDKSPENIEKALEISRKCIDYLQNKLQTHRSMPRSQRSYLDIQGKPAFEQPFSRAFSIGVKPNILTAAPQRTKSRDSTPSVVTLTFQDNQNVPKLSFQLNNSNTAGKQSTKRSRSRKETNERYSHADSGKLETFAKDSQELNQQGDLGLQNIDAGAELKETLVEQSKKPTPIITSEITAPPNLLMSKISPTNLLHEKVSAKLSSGSFANFAPKTSSRASIPTESDLVEYNLTTARGGISARSPRTALFSDRQPTSASKEINPPVTTKPWTPRTLSIELIPESAEENSKIAPTPVNHRKSDQFSVNSSIMKRKSTFEKLEQSISSTKANTFVSIKDIPSAGLVQSPTGALTLRATSKTPLTDRPKLNSLDEVNPQNSLVAAPALTSDQEINALLGKVLQPSSSAVNLYSGKSSFDQPKSSRITRTKGAFQGLGLNEIKYSMEPKNSEKKMFPLARMLSSQTPSYKENNPGFSSKLTSPKSYLEGKSLEKKLNKSNAEAKHSYRSSLQTDRPSSTISGSSKRTNQPNGTPITSPKAFETSTFKQTLNLKGIKIFEHQLPDRGTKTSRAHTPKTVNKNTPTATVAAQQAQARRLSLPKNTSQVAHHLRRNSSNLCLHENTQNFALDLPKNKNHRYSDVSPHKTINSLCSPRTPHAGKPLPQKESALPTRRVSIHENEECADSYYPVKKTCEHLDVSPKFQNLSSPKNSATKEQKPTILIDHKEQEDLDSDTEIIEENYDRTPHPDFLKMMKSVDVEFPPEEKLNDSQQSSGSFQLYDQLLKKNFYFQKEKPVKEELLQLNKKYPTLHIREVGESLVDSHESSHDTFIKKYSIGSGLHHLKSPTASSQSDTTKGKSFTSLHKQDHSSTLLKEEVSEIGKATTKPSLQSVEESNNKMISFLLANNQNHHSTKNLKKPVDLDKQAQSLNEGLRNLFHGKKSSLSALNLLISQNNSIKDKFSTLVTFGGGGTNQSEMTIDGLFADPNDYNVMTSPSSKNVQTLYKQTAPILMKKTYQEQKASYAEHRKDKIKSCTIELQSPAASLETKQLSGNLKLLQANETKKQNNTRYQEEHREPFQTTTNVGSLASVTNRVRPSPLFHSEASEVHDEHLGGRGITEEGYDIPDERMDNSNSFIVPVKELGGKDSLDIMRSPIKQKTETDTEDRYSEILTERTPEKLDNGDIVVGPLIGIKKVNS